MKQHNHQAIHSILCCAYYHYSTCDFFTYIVALQYFISGSRTLTKTEFRLGRYLGFSPLSRASLHKMKNIRPVSASLWILLLLEPLLISDTEHVLASPQRTWHQRGATLERQRLKILLQTWVQTRVPQDSLYIHHTCILALPIMWFNLLNLSPPVAALTW